MSDSDFVDRELLTLSVAIGTCEGSFVLAPEARSDDGQFNLLIATGLRRRDVCCYLPGLMFGKLLAHNPRIRYLLATELELCSSTPLHVHLDGEVYGGGIVPANSQIRIQQVSPIEIEVLRVY